MSCFYNFVAVIAVAIIVYPMAVVDHYVAIIVCGHRC